MAASAPLPESAPTAGTAAATWEPLADLLEWPANPKDHSGEHVDQILASVERFGWLEPIVANLRTRQIVSGHGRRLAALKKGMDLVPVRYVDLSEEDAELAALAANRIQELSGYDDSKLAAVLRRHSDKDRAGLLAAGFDRQSLLEALQRARPRTKRDPDHVPSNAPTRTSVGEVWRLGPHRVACGDSTNTSVLRALFDRTPDMVFTDPPYGIGFKAMRRSDEIANDESLRSAEAVITNALGLVADVGVAFVCCDWRSIDTVRRAMTSNGLPPKACIVWDKQRGVQNLDRYAKAHEFILYAGPFGGEKTEDIDIWRFARDFDPDHPTPKPVALVQKAVVYDAFAGSGSTVIACEESGREARVVELDARKCDVILARWEEHTGEKAVRAA